MRNIRFVASLAVSAAAVAGLLAAATPAQAATRVVAEGSKYNSNSGALGYMKISESDSALLTGFVTASDVKTDGACANARVVYKNSSNGVVATSPTAHDCTTNGSAVQVSVPTRSSSGVAKAVLEVWNDGGGKSTLTRNIG